MIQYLNYRVPGFENKYVNPKKLKEFIQRQNWNYQVLGKSQQNRDIYSVSLGNGPIKFAFWSQMHGNESTNTRALLDLFHYLDKEQPKFLNQFQLDWIPQLNPDGAAVWSRYSASGVDLNRDFIQESTPEIKILKSYIFKKSYKCIFNLHDQRNLFYTKNNLKSTEIAILSPVVGQHLMNENCILAKKYLAAIISKTREFTNVNLAKFNDSFYPLAAGDNFQKSVPTILVEAGYCLNDLQRNRIREQLFYFFYSLLQIDFSKPLKNFEAYQELPLNSEGAYDLILKNVKIIQNNQEVITALGIRFRDEFIDEQVKIIAEVIEIGDLNMAIGYEIFDAQGQILRNSELGYEIPQRGMKADFVLGKNIKIENGKIREIKL